MLVSLLFIAYTSCKTTCCAEIKHEEAPIALAPLEVFATVGEVAADVA